MVQWIEVNQKSVAEGSMKKRSPPRRREPSIHAYVGCYTTEKRTSHGAGITVYRVDPLSGAWTLLQTVGDLVNPSWVTLNRRQTVLYSSHADCDYATAFAINPDTGLLRQLNRAATGGFNGVRTMLDPSDRFLISANYKNGNVSVLPVNPDGSLEDCTQVVALPGEPRHLHRSEGQESSRPHDVVFDPSGRFVVIPDKGLDRVFVFRFDPKTGRLIPGEPEFTPARNGAGPRHIVFHPKQPLAWVINELDSTVSTYRWDRRRGRLTPIGVSSTQPGDFTADSWASEIALGPTGRTVYASNRGHNSVTILRVRRDSGIAQAVNWVLTGGRQPRFFGIDPTGRFLYAANQKSDEIVMFRIGGRDGSLQRTRVRIPVASPTTIAFRVG
jgi:6-phosphogluconolactonase